MLLSITIDTAHPDAQADALTAIKLLQNTFWADTDISALCRHSDDSGDDPATEPENLVPHMGATTDGPTTAPEAPAPLAQPRALIPGTDTYVPVDVNGLPWDKRIHASSQARTADGSWRRKPKVPDAEFQRVADELRTIMQAPAAGAILTASEEERGAPPPITPAEAFAPVSQVPTPESPMDFAALASWAGAHAHHQRLKYADMERVMRELGLVNAEGVGSLALIAHRPDLIPEAHTRLSALITAGEA